MTETGIMRCTRHPDAMNAEVVQVLSEASLVAIEELAPGKLDRHFFSSPQLAQEQWPAFQEAPGKFVLLQVGDYASSAGADLRRARRRILRLLDACRGLSLSPSWVRHLSSARNRQPVG